MVKNILDNAGELSTVEGKKTSGAGFWTYANSFTYTAAGGVSSMQLGNGRWESTQFNSRLQPTEIALGTTQSATDLLKLDYTYNTSGNNDNNGDILTQSVTVPTVGTNAGFTAIQAYSYDSLNRLSNATETESSTQTWKQEFSYDRYGNRNFVTGSGHTTTIPSGCGDPVCNPTVSTSNNRLTSTGYSYDSSGNTTADANSRTFVYDGENKQVQVSNGSGTIGQYWYDGDGKRVKKVVPSTGETTIFVYDAGGKEIAEYSTILASSTDAKVNYLTNDHLGSPRINTDANGAVISRHDYHPFGEEIDGTGGRTTGLNYGSDTVRKQFTGYERDAETDLDFAQARCYTKNFGRFSSPDPLLSTGRVEIPQSWNRYSYVLNNPLAFTDPLGLYEARGLTKEQIAKLEEEITLAEKLRDRYDKGSDEYKQADTALKALGRNGDGNGVIVKIGGDNPNEADTVVTKDGITVTFGRNLLDPHQDLLKPDSLGLEGKVVHEGTHVADGLHWRKTGETMNEFDSEMHAYMTEVSIERQRSDLLKEKGIIRGNLAVDVANGDRNDTFTTIYQPGWKEADIRTAIGNYLQTAPKYNHLDPKSKDSAFPTNQKHGGRP